MTASCKKERPCTLFVAPLMPSDRGNGLAMRTGFLLDAYAREFEVDLAVIPVAGGRVEISPYVAARTRRAAVLPLGPPDTQFSLVSSVANNEARLAAFRQYGRPSIAARLGAAMQQSLMAWTGSASYQLVHVSRLYLCGLAEAWTHGESDAPYLVLDCDEDDASAFWRLARLERKWGRHGRAAWLEAEAEAFRALQAQWLQRFDLTPRCLDRRSSITERSGRRKAGEGRAECHSRKAPRVGRRGACNRTGAISFSSAI